MKKILFILMLVCIKPAFSQSVSNKLQSLDKTKLEQPFAPKTWRGYKSESLENGKMNDTLIIRTQDNMPVIKPTDKQTFVFNNGRGSDVYVSSVDNMRVLKPDSTFVSSMPVKK